MDWIGWASKVFLSKTKINWDADKSMMVQKSGEHQLRSVGYPIGLLYIPGVCLGFLPSTVYVDPKQTRIKIFKRRPKIDLQ